MLVQKKIKKNKEFTQIVDEVEEDETVIKPIYHMIKEHPEKTTKEIYQLLNIKLLERFDCKKSCQIVK